MVQHCEHGTISKVPTVRDSLYARAAICVRRGHNVNAKRSFAAARAALTDTRKAESVDVVHTMWRVFCMDKCCKS